MRGRIRAAVGGIEQACLGRQRSLIPVEMTKGHEDEEARGEEEVELDVPQDGSEHRVRVAGDSFAKRCQWAGHVLCEKRGSTSFKTKFPGNL